MYIINVQTRFATEPTGVRALKILKDDTEELAYANSNAIIQDQVGTRLNLTAIAYLNANETIKALSYQQKSDTTGMVCPGNYTKIEIAQIGGQYA